MQTIRREVRTYQVILLCDCGAQMELTGVALMTHPAKYEHKCPKCGKREDLLESYPRIEYETLR